VRESASDTKQVYSFVEGTLAWLGTLDYIEKVAFFGAWEKVSVYHVWLLAEAFQEPGHLVIRPRQFHHTFGSPYQSRAALG
jgi:hypothetical protein